MGFSFAGTLFNADGSTSLHNRYYKNGKEVISPFKNQEATARWMANQNRFVGASTINAPVISGRTGAVSAGTVRATVTQGVSKRVVMGEILDKARTGGKALGRFAVGNSPYGRAFTLALLALEGSKYFWSDEEGDFVRPKDDNMYVVVASPNSLFLGGIEGGVVPSYLSIDKKSLDERCKNYSCEMLGFVSGRDNAAKKALDYCTSKKFSGYGAINESFDSVGAGGICFSHKRGVISSSYGVVAYLWADYVPITLDDFIDEATPEADAEPSDWVNTSQVKPDEEDVTVKGGTVAQTNPYTDPRDGKVKQTKWEFDDKDGDGDADTVRETTIERPDLPPNSPEAPELKPPTDTDTEDDTGTGDKDKPETASAPQPDLCEKNPDILACDKQPEKSELDEFPEIPTEEVNLKFEPDSVFPNAGQCPVPVSFQAMGGTYEISTQPVCDIAVKMRPFIIALAYLAAAFFVIRTIKSETS